MPREFNRKVRVAESIKRALGPLVSEWMRQHALGMASVTSSDVSPDLKRAEVFVSLYGCDNPLEALAQLNEFAPKLRYALGQELHLRRVPAIAFSLDQSIEQGDRLSRVLDSLKPDGHGH